MVYKKNWVDWPKIDPNLKISEIGQSGRKIDFKKILLGLTKIDIARWFLAQLTQFFLQMQAETYIYKMIGQFWV